MQGDLDAADMTVHEPNAAARLAAIVDSSYDAIISKDLSSTIMSWNRAAERLFGYTAEEAIGRSVLMLIPEDRQHEETDILDRLRRGERIENFETVRRRKDGRLIEVSLTISPIRDSEGRIVGASKIARDITPSKESERRIRILLREVNHRVKNQYSVILSMVRETNKRSRDTREFEGQLRERIMGLSRSHDLLVNGDWAGADMRELVTLQLAPFADEAKVEISGPDLLLKPGAVQALGMALHELATNSAKYGAMAQASGRIRIGWRLDGPSTAAPTFLFAWDESFAARRARRAANPLRGGFGSVVLERVAPQSLSGDAQLTIDPGRVVWTMRSPADVAIAGVPFVRPD